MTTAHTAPPRPDLSQQAVQAPPWVPTHPAHGGRTPPVAMAAARKQKWLLWLPLIATVFGGSIAMLAVGPSPARPAMRQAAMLPAVDTRGPAPLTWETGADRTAGHRLNVRPGFAVSSGGVEHPGFAPADDLDAELQAAPALAAHVPSPPTQYGLAELAPPTALDHHLTLESTLLDDDGMLATWGSRPLTSDADFETPLLDRTVDPASILRALDVGLEAGTPLAGEVAAYRPSAQWQPPAAPRRPDMPAPVRVTRPPPLEMPTLGSAPRAPATTRTVSPQMLASMWERATAPPQALNTPRGALTDEEFALKMRASAQPPRDLASWDDLTGLMGGLGDEYTRRASDPQFVPGEHDKNAFRQIFCGLGEGSNGLGGMSHWACGETGNLFDSLRSGLPQTGVSGQTGQQGTGQQGQSNRPLPHEYGPNGWYFGPKGVYYNAAYVQPTPTPNP